MVQNNNNNLLVLLLCLMAVCALPKLLALPITSKPFARSPDHLAWDVLNSDAFDSLEPSADGYEKPKKILPKSIFIAPTLTNSVTTCGPGYGTDHRGNCIETIQIDHTQLLLNQLNHLLGYHQQHTQQQPQSEDSYDYDYEAEPPTSPSTKDVQKGPFQLTLPVELGAQALQSPDPIEGSSALWTTTQKPMTTKTTTTTTTQKPLETLTSFLEGLLPALNRDPFGLTPKWPVSGPARTTTDAAVETTTNLPTTLSEDDEETTLSNPEIGVTMPYEQDTVGTSSKDVAGWSTSEFATELASEQLVPVTSTTTWDSTTSDAELLLSNAEGTTTYEVATETRDDMNRNGGIGTSSSVAGDDARTTTPISSSSVVFTTTTSRPEVTETVLPVQVTEKSPYPMFASVFSRNQISIVTPVPNPFPFQRTTFGSSGSGSSVGGSMFKFTLPVTTTTPRTTTGWPTTEAPTPVPELLLAVENESENTQKLRESLIESEQKEMNYENIDVNNRFIYHHLNGMPTIHGADQPQRQTTSTLAASQPIVVNEEEYRIASEDEAVTEKPLTASTQSFTEKLAAILHPKESERRRVPSPSSTLWSPPSTAVTTTPATTTTEPSTTPIYVARHSTATPSRFEEFVKSSSNRIRFPGPSVNRSPAPNKLIPSGQQQAAVSRTGSTGGVGADKEKKPFWWFPTGWEVDTKQKEKPVLLRFWTKMPLIPDSVATQRRSHAHSPTGQTGQSQGNRNNRGNSKSPSDNLYREVAFQDLSRAFQGRRLSSNDGST